MADLCGFGILDVYTIVHQLSPFALVERCLYLYHLHMKEKTKTRKNFRALSITTQLLQKRYTDSESKLELFLTTESSFAVIKRDRYLFTIVFEIM